MTRRNYHETFHESTQASVNQGMQYINFIEYFRHQTEVFSSSTILHRPVSLLVNTHIKQQHKDATYWF